MATNTKTAPGSSKAASFDAGSVRKTAQREFISSLQEALTKKDKNAPVGVFVLPIFDDKGKNTNKVVRETVSQTLSMIMVMSVGPLAYVPEQRMYRQDIRNSLIFAPTKFLDTEFKAGQNLGGKIVTKYSFGTGNDRDIMLGIGTDIPAVNDAGEVIYRSQYWTPDMDEQDDETPTIANLEDIRKARAVAVAANNGKLPAKK